MAKADKRNFLLTVAGVVVGGIALQAVLARSATVKRLIGG